MYKVMVAQILDACYTQLHQALGILVSQAKVGQSLKLSNPYLTEEGDDSEHSSVSLWLRSRYLWATFLLTPAVYSDHIRILALDGWWRRW
jgi:hypothetical protein